MRYPYERFLRFLVSRKVDVNQTLARYGLPAVGGLWIPACRTSFRETAPFAMVRHLDSADDALLTHDGVLDWAESEGFRLLWEIQPEFGGRPIPPELDIASRIFSNPNSRWRMGIFLFSKATPSEVVEVTKALFDMEVDQTVVDLYRRVFWDTSAMAATDWTRLIASMDDKEERHYLALGLEKPTLDGAQCLLGLKYAQEPEVVLRRLMNTAIEQYDLAIKQPIPVAHDVFKWGEAAKSAAIALAAHIPKKAPTNAIPNDFNGLFTVQISKSKHISLADLKGQVGAPVPTKMAAPEAT